LIKERPFGEEVVMTTRQTPQTPIWRRVLSLPRMRLGWWAAGLAGITLLAAVLIPPDPEDAINPSQWDYILEILTVPTTLVGALVGGIVGALALGAGERSLLVWVSQVPAAFLFAGMTSIFQEGSFFINGSVGVVIWAAIAFGIFYLRSQVRSP
jgi:hypothetical protein